MSNRGTLHRAFFPGALILDRSGLLDAVGTAANGRARMMEKYPRSERARLFALQSISRSVFESVQLIIEESGGERIARVHYDFAGIIVRPANDGASFPRSCLPFLRPRPKAAS